MDQLVRTTCPNCHRPGTIKGGSALVDGAKLRCAGCEHTYTYRESYDVQEPEIPLPPTPNPGTPPEPTPLKAAADRPPRKFPITLRSLVQFFIRLPGWASITTGVLQTIILVGGTAIGTVGAHGLAMDRYQGQQADLARKKQAVQGDLAGLANQMQQLANQMQHLANQMRQLIDQHQLRIELPAPEATAPAANPLTTTPGVRLQEGTQEEARRAALREYLALKAKHQQLESDLKSLKDRYEEREGDLLKFDRITISSPSLLEGLGTSLAGSSIASGGFPFLVAWVAWITGIVLITAGVCWLALIEWFALREAQA
jgi:hypothetical protein